MPTIYHKKDYSCIKKSFFLNFKENSRFNRVLQKPHIFRFKPLEESDFDLVYHWFNQPHVQDFYSLRSWTLEEVQKKLLPYLNKEKGVQAYIAYLNKKPIGYIQSCPIKEHPWADQDLSESVIETAAGIDLFLGSPFS